MDYASVTKRVRGSSPGPVGHFGGRRQLAVVRLVIIPNTLKPYVVPWHSAPKETGKSVIRSSDSFVLFLVYLTNSDH